ncbi:O-antigen export system, permease protein [Euzebya pacifica]|uniref:O-antigen export system, permease protein n=2 Tax=Euzebya pacifica TaxID=1608957 RepID=A0A346XW19_9ACTN|nr:O-antigen export system, permease protein [Euzebya pacifica]
MHYTMFSQAITGGAGAILAQERLLLQVRIEPIIFVGASYRETMTNGLLGVGAFFVFYLLSGDPSEADWGLYVIALLALATLAWACALAAASLTVFLRDVRLALPIGLRLLLYACPVIYPTDFVPEKLQTVYFLNPVASVFGILQHALFGTPAPPRLSLIVSAGAIAVALVAAHLLYGRSEPKFTKAF